MFFFIGQSDRVVKLTAHLDIVPRLMMNVAVLLLPLFALVACTGTA
jgi:hypothetical protein